SRGGYCRLMEPPGVSATEGDDAAPQKERDRHGEDDLRPGQAEPDDLVAPDRLDGEAEERVPGDVEREEVRGVGEAFAGDPEHEEGGEVEGDLVPEGGVEGGTD